MNKEKAELFVLLLVGVICFGVIFAFLMNRVIGVIAPFIIAWLVAVAVDTPALRLEDKTGISKRFWRPVLAIGGTGLIFTVFILLGWQMVELLRQILTDTATDGKIYSILEKLSAPRILFAGVEIPVELEIKIGEGIQAVIVNLLEKLGSLITTIVGFVPRVLIFILITLISLFYFSIDIDRINNGIKSVLPTKISNKLSEIRRDFFDVLGKYVKSYLQIMVITFIIMLIGFLILGVERGFLIAVLVSALDLLPVLGVGVVIVPWSVISFVLGDLKEGIGLLVIFIVYTVIRELIEPKILGKSLNVHPVITLVSLYAGYAFFGFCGLIAFPVLAVLIGQLFKKNKTAKVGEG